MENLQIGKDLGNDRNGRDRHPDRQNDDERKFVSLRASDGRPNQHRANTRSMTNGIPVPTIASQLTSHLSSRLNNCFVSAQT
jgi:hypothetical protein